MHLLRATEAGSSELCPHNIRKLGFLRQQRLGELVRQFGA